MKILCLADLHMTTREGFPSADNIRYLIEKESPDVIAIAGDIFDFDVSDPYETLAEIVVKDIPVVCCLGNHEFAYNSVANVIDKYATLYKPEKYDVHYLDVCGHRLVSKSLEEKVNFVGNVLWYDGSMYPGGGMPEEVNKHWLDSTIEDFNWKAENKGCVDQIKVGLLLGETNILLTHCVPHARLNMHPSTSKMNGYSGMSDLFKELRGGPKISWVICGHTHRYCTAEIDGVFCVNVGNDYAFTGKSFKHFVLEV